MGNARKSPGPKTRVSRRNSLDNSKAEIHLGISEFDPSQGSAGVEFKLAYGGLIHELPHFGDARIFLASRDGGDPLKTAGPMPRLS
jgi:hypothetical protein